MGAQFVPGFTHHRVVFRYSEEPEGFEPPEALTPTVFRTATHTNVSDSVVLLVAMLTIRSIGVNGPHMFVSISLGGVTSARYRLSSRVLDNCPWLADWALAGGFRYMPGHSYLLREVQVWPSG